MEDTLEVSFNGVLNMLTSVENVLTLPAQEEGDSAVLHAVAGDLEKLESADTEVDRILENMLEPPAVADSQVPSAAAVDRRLVDALMNVCVFASYACDDMRVREFIGQSLKNRHPAFLHLLRATKVTKRVFVKLLDLWVRIGAHLDVEALTNCKPNILRKSSDPRVAAGLVPSKIINEREDPPMHEVLKYEITPIMLQARNLTL